MLLRHLLCVITVLVVVSCDLAKDTAATSEGGAQGAADIAEKMSQGTAGDADPDSDESSPDDTGT